jgi:hypothetical protein
MAVITWPSGVKISEMQLGVLPPSRGGFGIVNRYPRFSATLTEVWGGQIALAAVAQDDKRALELFVARLQGRLNTFNMPLPSGHWGGSNAGGTLLAATSRGGNRLNLSAAAQAGDVITITSGGNTQTVECLESGFRPEVAPRLRFAFPPGATYAAASTLPLRLSSDDGGRVETVLHHGICMLPVVEAV